MAAPHLPHTPHHPPADVGPDERSARIAQLAAQLESLTQSVPRPARDQDRVSPGGVSTVPGTVEGAADRAKGSRATPVSAQGSVGGATASPATVVGPSIRAANRNEGGHPEDPPGDPEVVAKAICLRLLTSAARPRAALALALRKRGIPDQVADAVLDRFVEVGLIDDEAYARDFIAAKARDRGLGVAALRTELRSKGVDEEVVAAAVESIDQQAERSRARALIERRVDAAMSAGAVAARRRLAALLARRGYSADIALSVVDEALAAYTADDRWDS